jgi:hypothetical protein
MNDLGINITQEREDTLNKAIQLMRSHGVIIVDPVNITGIDNDRMYDDLWSLLLSTFPEDIATYLADLSNTTIRSLSDLIEFNLNHTEEEFHPQFAPNQLVFEWSNNLTNLLSANQSSLLNKTQVWARELGIDAA